MSPSDPLRLEPAGPPLSRRQRGWGRWALLGLLFAGGLGLRLYKLDQPPLDFQPTRQYRSALLARRFYLEGLADAPTWRRELAARNAPPIYEPPLLERAVAGLYRLTGGESLIVPRLLSIAIWLVGGALMWPVARRLGSENGAFAAVAYFLFLPFGVLASRAFQPDPLMVALMLASVLTALRFGERPTSGRAAALGAAVAAAVLVKPMSVFQLGLGALAQAVWLWRQGRARAARVAVLAVVAGLVPAAIFYGRSWLTGGSAANIAELSFIPRLLLGVPFWRGWLAQVWKVVGFLAVAAGLLGLVALRGWQRWLVGGMWLGYGVFSAVFTYQAFTHDYYHLQLVPLVALSLAPPVGWLVDSLRDRLGRGVELLPAVVLLAASLDAATASVDRLRFLDTTGEAATYREVGEVVGHSRDTVFLANFYGYPLLYYGEIAGKYWPHWFDARLDTLLGRSATPPARRLAALDREGRLRYFVVTNLGEFERQAELRRLLDASCRVFARTDRYVIYDLRRAPGPAPPG